MITSKQREDMTMSRNYIARMLVLIDEYELIKAHKHPQYKYVKDFLKSNRLCKKSFYRFYNRYKQTGKVSSLLPEKRGPKYRLKVYSTELENEIIELRNQGLSKWDINLLLKSKSSGKTPSPSTIYNIFKANNLNVLNPKQKEAKVSYVKKQIGELAHSDSYYLPHGIIPSEPKNRYLIGIIDDCSRTVWCELVDDLSSLTSMFILLRCFAALNIRYQIKVAELMTDNGPEFGGRPSKNIAKQIQENPTRRMLYEQGIKHYQIRPYRPQTNGKIERFWKTLQAEFLDGATFNSVEEFCEELAKFLIYYNEHRPHQGLGGKTPLQVIKELRNKEAKMELHDV